MGLGDLTSREAVIAAVQEYDKIGEEAFLSKYGYGPARRFFLILGGKLYPSKAILGVARGYQEINLSDFLLPEDLDFVPNNSCVSPFNLKWRLMFE